MKLEKLPSGSYRAQKIYKGKRYRLTFDHKPTEKELTIAFADVMQAADYGKNGTFEKFALEYIENRKNVVSPATVRTYNIKINQLSDDFKKKNIYDIDNNDVQIEINTFAIDHAPKTVRSLHGFISSVMGAYRPNLRLKTKLPQAIKKDEYEPSSDDIKRILDLAKDTRYSIPFQLGVMGCRRGEIVAADISDLKDNELWVHRDMVYNDGQWIIKECPKTDASNRKLILPDSLVKEINDQGFIFNGHPNALNKAIHRFQKQLDIPAFKFHLLRSYFCSYSHSLGISEADIMSMGGWATPSVMKSVYRKSLEESKKKSMQLFNQKMWG